MCSGITECCCLIVMVQVVQNLRHGIAGGIFRKNGFDIIFMVAQQHRPEQDQHGIKECIAVFFMSEIFYIHGFKHIADSDIIIRVKYQVISLGFTVKHMSKKLCQSTVSSQGLKEG